MMLWMSVSEGVRSCRVVYAIFVLSSWWLVMLNLYEGALPEMYDTSAHYIRLAADHA